MLGAVHIMFQNLRISQPSKTKHGDSFFDSLSCKVLLNKCLTGSVHKWHKLLPTHKENPHPSSDQVDEMLLHKLGQFLGATLKNDL